MTSSKPTTRYQDIRRNVAKIHEYLARGGGLGKVLTEQIMAYDAIRMCFLEISEAAIKLGALAESHEPDMARCPMAMHNCHDFHAFTASRRPNLLTTALRRYERGIDEALRFIDLALIAQRIGQIREHLAQHFFAFALSQGAMHAHSGTSGYPESATEEYEPPWSSGLPACILSGSRECDSSSPAAC